MPLALEFLLIADLFKTDAKLYFAYASNVKKGSAWFLDFNARVMVEAVFVCGAGLVGGLGVQVVDGFRIDFADLGVGISDVWVGEGVGVEVGDGVVVGDGLGLGVGNGVGVGIGDGVVVGDGVWVGDGVVVGDGVWVGDGVVVDDGVVVGDEV